ncbi:unnamed protein product [Haemonchus placei]|uniref:ShKT domain-containing protein n=1 Tax=Haemonchus placei TaxID=6290 RepID=A0A0N4WYZ2_HAEPC|nr:unnamed protein product [Haemonchus placei]
MMLSLILLLAATVSGTSVEPSPITNSTKPITQEPVSPVPHGAPVSHNITTSNPVAAPAPKLAAGKPKCVDKPICATMARDGFCNMKFSKQVVKSNCPVLCKLCDS